MKSIDILAEAAIEERCVDVPASTIFHGNAPLVLPVLEQAFSCRIPACKHEHESQRFPMRTRLASQSISHNQAYTYL